jgi:hypothetical protein
VRADVADRLAHVGLGEVERHALPQEHRLSRGVVPGRLQLLKRIVPGEVDRYEARVLDIDPGLLEAGDLVALVSAGAYGAVMASTYNSRLLIPEVLVKGADHAVVRPRTTFEDLIALDCVPDWLA